MPIETGWYKALSTVNIRREPRIVEYRDKQGKLTTNAVGQISIGTRRKVVDVVTDKWNATWGQVLESDNAGIGGWCCIQGVNRTFMELVPEDGDDDKSVEVSAKLLEDVLERLFKLEAWAKTKGYK